jgi:iron complex outermembrane receptor protein
MMSLDSRNAGLPAAHRRAGDARRAMTLLALAGLWAAPPAFAADEDGASGQSGQITVTARKREERVQDVPISLTVLHGDRLGLSPIASNAELNRAVPNVAFVDVGGQSSNFSNVRGVGSFSPVAADDTSVVYYVGEVPQSVYGASPNLVDVDRIEILRGPQGTLFGRNTQAGAISIVPAKPVFENTFSARGEGGSHGYGMVEAVGNAALDQDRLAARIAVRYATYGGDIPNIAAGGKDGGLDIGAVRLSLLFRPTDRTDALLTASYGREHTHSPRFLLRDAAAFPISVTNPRTEVDSETGGAALRIDHRFDGLTMTSLSSFQRNTSTQNLDFTDGLVFAKVTGLPPSFFNLPRADFARLGLRENQYLQEVRIASPDGGGLSWTAGLNYFRSELGSDRDARAATLAFLTTNGIQDNSFTTDSFAVFGEATVPLAPRLDVTLGLRGTHERKRASYRFSANGLPGVFPASSQDAALTDDFVTGRAILRYRWSPDVMTYASVSRGYVSSGFPAISVNSALGKPDERFPASISWTYEAGAKATLLDGRLFLGASVFYNDLRNGHLAAFLPSQAIFTMAALDYDSVGGEFEITARPAEGFELTGGIGYTRARLKNIAVGHATGAKTGNTVPNVPDITASASASYRWSSRSLGLAGEFAGRVSYNHVASRAADVVNSFELAAYDLVNARLGWEGRGIGIYIFANNLFDQRYQSWGQSFGPVATVRVGQGRIVGAGLSVGF